MTKICNASGQRWNLSRRAASPSPLAYLIWSGRKSRLFKTAKIPPAMNQIEFHPYFQRPSLISWLKEQNIAVACYSPLFPLNAGKPGPIDGIFQELAEKYGVTTSEIGLRWCIDQGLVPVSTSSKKERIQRYITEIPKFKLSPKEVSDIVELGRQKNISAYWKYYANSGGDK